MKDYTHTHTNTISHKSLEKSLIKLKKKIVKNASKNINFIRQRQKSKKPQQEINIKRKPTNAL